MKQSRLTPLLSVLIFGMLLLGGKTMAEGTTVVLKGKVTDISDNWLNGAQVTLKPMGVQVRTDANGEFTLNVEADDRLQRNKCTLIVERSGHITKRVPIKPMDVLQDTKPIVVKLEPTPVDRNLVGFTVEMEAPKRRKGTLAEFHVYIPESVEKVRAAFYISRHGMGDITREVLKKFAEHEQVALVGMYGDPVQRGVDSVAVLDKHIKKLAEMSGHPELPNVPIMTFGHSNGTGFAGCWPKDRPDKVIAWVSFHPGFSDYLQYPNTEKVPAMVMCGSIDKYLLRSRQDQVVAEMRKTRNAAMCVMMEGGVGHGPADADAAWEFVTEFLKSAMRVRLAEDGTLKPVDIKSGWLGATYNFEQSGRQRLDVAPYAEFKGDKSTASWLPDGEFAKVWQRYGQKEPVKRKPAPKK